ncbi:MAG: hypothetical protein ABSA83_23835 [Verrucomicrobiota bacterium]
MTGFQNGEQIESGMKALATTDVHSTTLPEKAALPAPLLAGILARIFYPGNSRWRLPLRCCASRHDSAVAQLSMLVVIGFSMEFLYE